MQSQTSSYVLTTLVTAPASLGLTTLDNVKDDLDIPSSDTSNDRRLTRYITEESANIARYCNRVFGLATWQDEFRPQRGVWGEGVRAASNPLKLTRWPLARGSIAFSGNTHSNLLIDSIASTAGLVAGMPVIGTGIALGTTVATVLPTAILLSTAATLTATAVSLTAGMSVIETIVGVDKTLIAGTDFEIDKGSLQPGDEGVGALYRLNHEGNPRTWSQTKVTVLYQAGYTLPGDADACVTPNLPPDLESACLRIVVGRHMAKGRDPMLRSKDQPTLGRTEYWVGATPGQTGPYPNEIMSTLDRYRVPVIG